MRFPQPLLCCALAIMLSSTGWARIGESIEQCIGRYGKPIDSFPPKHANPSLLLLSEVDELLHLAPAPQEWIDSVYHWSVNGYFVTAWLIDGKVESIRLYREALLEGDELKALLERNLGPGFVFVEDLNRYLSQDLVSIMAQREPRSCVTFWTKKWFEARAAHLLREQETKTRKAKEELATQLRKLENF